MHVYAVYIHLLSLYIRVAGSDIEWLLAFRVESYSATLRHRGAALRDTGVTL